MAVNNPAYDIVINYSGNAAYQSYFTAAERMWELVITADIPNYSGLPSPWPASVDDLYIDASVTAIDGVGGVLGSAGPYYIRSPSLLPITGTMQFDSADIANMAAAGTLGGVILHEMGHVLGIGTLWGAGDWNLVSAGPNYQYTGAAALAEYRLLANNPAATFIQVENGGGSGTAGGHWDEATFDRELMTGYVDSTMQLSRMSIAMLRDAGYTVDLGTADPYFLASTPLALRDDFSGNYNATTVVSVGGTITGNVELDEDNDWFVVNLTAGVSYTFTMRGSPTVGGTLTDAFLRLRAADGEILAFNDNNGTNNDSSIAFTASTTGTYYLDASAAGTQTGTYTVSFSSAGLFSESAEYVQLTTSGGTWSALGGNDTVIGTAGSDTVNGDGGNDILYSLDGVDSVNGGAGNDVIVLGSGNDTGSGGADNDYIYAGVGEDLLDGDAGIDILIGEDGGDTLNGGADNDYLYGGSGTNSLNGGDGDDVFISQGVFDVLVGGSGHNYFYVFGAGSSVTGGTGIDEFVGGAALSNDTVSGGDGQDYLYGGDGNDSLSGNAGDDVLLGEDGIDTIFGGTGINAQWGGAGPDTFVAEVALGAQTQVINDFAITDTVRIIGSTLTSFADIQALIATPSAPIGSNMIVNSASGAQLYLNLGAQQTAIWIQGVSIYSLTASDFAFS